MLIYRVIKEFKDHQNRMGKTGAGLSHEDEIDGDLNPTLANVWGASQLFAVKGRARS